MRRSIPVVVFAGLVWGIGLVVAESVASNQAAGPVADTDSSSSGPVILYAHDLGREIHHFGLRPTTVLLEATGWRGLYEQPGGYEVRAARVAVALRVVDTTYDTVFTITADPPDPVLLFAGIPAIPSGPVTYSTLYHRSLWVDVTGETQDDIDLVLGSRSYRIRLTAHDDELCDAVVALHHEGQVRELYPLGPRLCDGPHFELKWAGDLDGDGRLDLLGTFSGKYSVHPRQLFLSGSSDDGLAIPVATYEPY